MNATVLHNFSRTSLRSIPHNRKRDLLFEARNHRHLLRNNPDAHDFILWVRQISGATVAGTVWREIRRFLKREPHIRLVKSPELRFLPRPEPGKDAWIHWIRLFAKRIV